MKHIVSTASLGAAMALAGCVSINAPDKPIEINLNINVKQEVVYRLDNQAKTVIQSNPGIF
ncbi:MULTISPECIES: YnbE family lipoprotein [unclassified Sphingomonas]|uniref:YnbE family lipoprotein n=1 Tax=unclassified Sphingomonas TaxID=196159 RepID=UPI00028A2F05|nr:MULTISPECIES: YnbE family lipoprotein [unclassified Sphingomonas]